MTAVYFENVLMLFTAKYPKQKGLEQPYLQSVHVICVHFWVKNYFAPGVCLKEGKNYRSPIIVFEWNCILMKEYQPFVSQS